MYVRSYERHLMQYVEYRILKYLLLYIPPILLILGTVGNILSFIILMRRSMRKFSTYIYLAILSITDTLVLYIGLLRLWIGELNGFDVKNQADWICKLISVAGYTVSDYSVWLIIAVTVERYVAVCYPLHASMMCNLRRAITVMTSLLIILFFINSHFFWTVHIKQYKIQDEIIYNCEGAPKYVRLVDDVWPWVDAILYSFLPFVIIMVLNGLIIRQVVRARRSRDGLQSTQPDHRRRARESSIKLTIMLLTISFAFLLTTLPMNISLIISAFYHNYLNDLHFLSRFKLARTITELLMYVNHSMNFFLYCATGQKFRHNLLLMLCHRFGYNTRNCVLMMENSHNSHNSHNSQSQLNCNTANNPRRTYDSELLTFTDYPNNVRKKPFLIAEVQRGNYVQMRICNSR